MLFRSGLDVLKESRTGLLVYVVDTTIPSIKGIAFTYPRKGANPDLTDATLKNGDTIKVGDINISAGPRNGNYFEVRISK